MIRFVSYGITAAVAASLAAGGAVGFNHPTPVTITYTVTVTNTVAVTPAACLTAITLADQSLGLLSDVLTQSTAFDTAISAYDFTSVEAATAQFASDANQMPVAAYQAAKGECQNASGTTD